MLVLVIEIRRLPGSKEISSGVAASGYHLPSGGSLLMTSAVTHVTQTSCAAWASSHKLILRIPEVDPNRRSPRLLRTLATQEKGKKVAGHSHEVIPTLPFAR